MAERSATRPQGVTRCARAGLLPGTCLSLVALGPRGCYQLRAASAGGQPFLQGGQGRPEEQQGLRHGGDRPLEDPPLPGRGPKGQRQTGSRQEGRKEGPPGGAVGVGRWPPGAPLGGGRWAPVDDVSEAPDPPVPAGCCRPAAPLWRRPRFRVRGAMAATEDDPGSSTQRGKKRAPRSGEEFRATAFAPVRRRPRAAAAKFRLCNPPVVGLCTHRPPVDGPSARHLRANGHRRERLGPEP